MEINDILVGDTIKITAPKVDGRNDFWQFTVNSVEPDSILSKGFGFLKSDITDQYTIELINRPEVKIEVGALISKRDCWTRLPGGSVVRKHRPGISFSSPPLLVGTRGFVSQHGVIVETWDGINDTKANEPAQFRIEWLSGKV